MPLSTPSVKLTPNALPKFERNDEAVFTFAKPSEPQKRPCANGKSADTQYTSVLFNDEASELNVRVLVAHVGVSMLGKMFKITRLPRKSLFEISCSVPVVSVNDGAAAPFFGNLPLVDTGLPPSVTFEPPLLAVFFAAFSGLLDGLLFATFFTIFFLAIFFLQTFFLQPWWHSLFAR